VTIYPSDEIQRRTSLSRNTIKAWLKETRPDNYKYPERAKVDGKLTPFVSTLLLALEADSRRPKRDRRTALMLFEAIKKDGYYRRLFDSDGLCPQLAEWCNHLKQIGLCAAQNSNLAKPSSLIGAMNG